MNLTDAKNSHGIDGIQMKEWTKGDVDENGEGKREYSRDEKREDVRQRGCWVAAIRHQMLLIH